MIGEAGIRAVAFDLGGTLEEIHYDEAMRLEASRGLRDLLASRGLDPGLDVPILYTTVMAGLNAYHRWREESEIELPPERVWAEYILPDYGLPRERLEAAAEDLALFYENRFFHRRMRPEAPVALERLRERGLRLAVISNVMACGQVHRCLGNYGLLEYFDPIIASSVFGWRKPNPRIFLEAARLLGLPPESCAYVGDTISRDVAGARRAGFGLAIQIRSFLSGLADRPSDSEQPDALIESLLQVADVLEGQTGGVGAASAGFENTT